MSRRDLLDIVHQGARQGTLLTSCEPEVQELMHQIDVMLTTHRQEMSERETAVKSQLQARERELSVLRVTVQERNSQVASLKDELAQLEHQLRVKTNDHETQLLRLRSELNRLNKGYEKLKSRRKASSKEPVGDTALKSATEQLRLLQLHCESRESELNQMKQDLQLAQAEGASFRDRSSALEEELRLCQAEAEQKLSLSASSEETLRVKMRQLDAELQQASEVISKQEKSTNRVTVERDEVRKQLKASLADGQKLREKLQSLQAVHKDLHERNLHLMQTLQRSSQQSEVVEKERADTNKQVEIMKEAIENKDILIRSLEERHQKWVEIESSALRKQVTQLQEKLKRHLDKEKTLKEDNTRLRKRLEGYKQSRRSSEESQSGKRSLLERRDAEITEYQTMLLDKEQSIQAMQERVAHLEDQLSEATQQLDSSETQLQVAGHQVTALRAENKLLKESPLFLSPLSKDASLQSKSPLSVISSPRAGASGNGSQQAHEEIATAEVADLGNNGHKMVTPEESPGVHGPSLPLVSVEVFRQSLDQIVSRHMAQISHSLQGVLETSFPHQ